MGCLQFLALPMYRGLSGLEERKLNRDGLTRHAPCAQGAAVRQKGDYTRMSDFLAGRISPRSEPPPEGGGFTEGGCFPYYSGKENFNSAIWRKDET